jgi:hypothetical protein
MLTCDQINRVRDDAMGWDLPGATARVVKACEDGVLVAIVRDKRSITVEVVEPQARAGTHAMLDYAAGLLRDRRPVAPTAGMGRG